MAQVRAQVDRIRDEKQADAKVEDGLCEMPADVRGQPAPGLERNAGAGLLCRGHERNGEKRRPQLPIPECGTRLRIGADARGIVVGRAGDEPRSERPHVRLDSIQPAGWLGFFLHRSSLGYRRRVPRASFSTRHNGSALGDNTASNAPGWRDASG